MKKEVRRRDRRPCRRSATLKTRELFFSRASPAGRSMRARGTTAHLPPHVPTRKQTTLTSGEKAQAKKKQALINKAKGATP